MTNTKTQGEIARAELQRRGLIFFDDVMHEVRALPDPRIQNVLAVAAAHNLGQKRLVGGKADALDRKCIDAVESMWLALSGAGEEWAWPAEFDSILASEDADRDFVAATLYAGQAMAGKDGEAAAWAVSRLIDERFPESGGTAEDFVTDCAAPQVQAALGKIRSSIQALRDLGVSAGIISEIRRTFDAG